MSFLILHAVGFLHFYVGLGTTISRNNFVQISCNCFSWIPTFQNDGWKEATSCHGDWRHVQEASASMGRKVPPEDVRLFSVLFVISWGTGLVCSPTVGKSLRLVQSTSTHQLVIFPLTVWKNWWLMKTLYPSWPNWLTQKTCRTCYFTGLQEPER